MAMWMMIVTTTLKPIDLGSAVVHYRVIREFCNDERQTPTITIKISNNIHIMSFQHLIIMQDFVSIIISKTNRHEWQEHVVCIQGFCVVPESPQNITSSILTGEFCTKTNLQSVNMLKWLRCWVKTATLKFIFSC
jgi:hypothetical protein